MNVHALTSHIHLPSQDLARTPSLEVKNLSAKPSSQNHVVTICPLFNPKALTQTLWLCLPLTWTLENQPRLPRYQIATLEAYSVQTLTRKLIRASPWLLPLASGPTLCISFFSPPTSCFWRPDNQESLYAGRKGTWGRVWL